MTTKEIAAEAARLALQGAAAHPDPADAEPYAFENTTAYILRLVHLGATLERYAR